MFHDGKIELKEFNSGNRNLKDLESLIWRDYFETYKNEFSTDRSVVGSLGSPVDIYYKYICNYYIAAFICRSPALCSIQPQGFGLGTDDVISDQDGIFHSSSQSPGAHHDHQVQ